ncbi:hypothetical protein L218DRAFT_113204 [Marasmius fiardii PR-910]|nr:hypothetical protein L218DRAFT_113204 [Marasmius fiardii PR-910]
MFPSSVFFFSLLVHCCCPLFSTSEAGFRLWFSSDADIRGSFLSPFFRQRLAMFLTTSHLLITSPPGWSLEQNSFLACNIIPLPSPLWVVYSLLFLLLFPSNL